MRAFAKLWIFTGLLLQGSYCMGQGTPADAELEGPLKSVDPMTGELSVMGMRVIVDGTTKIESPSSPLTLDQLKDETPLPGRTAKGFEGGTATVIGTVDPATGVVTATSVHVEPAENVILGVVTDNAAGQLKVNKVPIEYLNDARMPLTAVQNEFGFRVKRETIPVNTPASVEGYFDGSVFRAFLVEIDGPADLETGTPQISILRAQTRDRRPGRADEVNVRGAVTMSHAAAGVNTQTIAIYRVDEGFPDSLLGTVQAQRIADNPGFARWTFSGQTPVSNHPVYSHAPGKIRARNMSDNAGLVSTDLDAEVRVD
ncbi:MAG: hypothetical protein JNM43_29480 [Planctomycetaceae bacterium]|nr:hypothetical protein [Planctomycetaceae bacterium]